MSTEFSMNLLRLGLVQVALGLGLIAILMLVLQSFTSINAVTRYRLWLLAFLVTALLPFFALLPRPEFSMPVVNTSVIQNEPISLQELDQKPPTVINDVNTRENKTHISLSPMIARMFVLLWLLILVWRSTRLYTSFRGAKNFESRARACDPDLTNWIEEARKDLGIKQNVRVYQVTGLSSPMTVGLRRPWIAIPLGLSGQVEPVALQHALLHELAHIRRKDSWVSLFQKFFEALWAFNPVLVWMSQRINLERENACDDWAISYGHGSKAYAKSLLHLLETMRFTAGPLFAVGCIESKSQLSRRITTMLDKEIDHGVIGRKVIVIMSGVVMSVALVFSAAALPQFAPLLSNGSAFCLGDCDYSDTILGAAKKGDAAEVQRYISEGADVNQIFRKSSPRTALNAAAGGGYLEVVRLLVVNGADVDRVVRGDAPALTAAARHGHYEVAAYLLQQGAKAEQPVRGDGSALIGAAGTGNVELVRLLIESGANVNSKVRGDGTPLIQASRRGNKDIVALLLENGADPNLGSRGDETPLHHASRNGDLEITQLLVDAGADVNNVLMGDGTALMQAIDAGNDDLVELLIQNGAKVNERVFGDGSALITAARKNDTSTAQKLIASGADVNRGVRGDGNPLISAAMRGNQEMVRLLVENGADVNGKVKGDDTVLINAVRSGDVDIVGYLIEQGAKVDLEGDFDHRLGEQRTPLNQARSDQVIRALKGAGAT